MAINVQVEKNTNESSANVMRRFQKRMQNSGIVRRLREERYFSRGKSSNVRKTTRLKKLAKKTAYEKAYKLGRIVEKTRRR